MSGNNSDLNILELQTTVRLVTGTTLSLHASPQFSTIAPWARIMNFELTRCDEVITFT